jgi:catechol 2,3-dioxygenase-like lactoylglutathione lyase family enzyme
MWRSGAITFFPRSLKHVAEARSITQYRYRMLLWTVTLSTSQEGGMAKIRHLAIKTKNPEQLASFYETVFDLKRIRSEPGGAIYMSDGYLTLALLRNRGEATPSGINHFGFHVEDLAEIKSRLQEFEEPLVQRPANRPYAEYRAMDPDGNLFDVSVHGYDEAEFQADRDKLSLETKTKALS